MPVINTEHRTMTVSHRTKSEPVLCNTGTSCSLLDQPPDCVDRSRAQCNGMVCMNGETGTLSPGMCDHSQYVALDCEFVGVGPRKLSALGRCSIVDYYGRVVCDIYARPDEPITDYRTPWSGIRKRDMIRAIPVESARNIIKNIIRDKVVVGHALHHDFSVLRMDDLVPPEMRRDTSLSFQLRKLAGVADRPVASLKALTVAILGRRIQTSEHDSVEDARAAMDLFKCVKSEWKTEGEEPKKELVKSCTSQKRKQSEGRFMQRVGREYVKRLRLDSGSTSTPFFSDDYWPNDIQVCWF